MRSWSGRRVFITGHTGFKGAWLALWLQRLGAEVVGYSLRPPTVPSLFELAGVGKGMRSIQADVRDADRLKAELAGAAPEIVFHLAAQSLVRASYADPAGTYATNVMGTAHLLEAVRHASRVRAVVVVTSDKCYENLGRPAPYRESDRLGGHDAYSSSKACAELVTQSYRDAFFSTGPSVATARAGNVIGGGDWAADRLLPDLVRAALERRAAPVRYPDAVRPWQHVLDPLAGYLELAERLASEGARFAEPWNFGPDESGAASVRQLAEQFALQWGEGAGWEADRRPQPREAALLRLDASKARQRLGWRPTWDFAHALERSVAWYKAQARGADMRGMTLDQIAEFERARAPAIQPG